MREPDSGVEVLVAGAGPVGLTAAHELARRGVRVRVVDRASGPATTSRALATHARTLEICHQMGVLDRLLARGRRVEHFSMHMRGRQLVRFDTNYTTLPTRFPFSLMVDQVVTEGVLRDSLADLGVPIEWGVELVDFDRHHDRVDVRLRHADGTPETMTVPWLVGTDGAHSTVRKRLGFRLLGDSAQTWLNVDVTLDADLPANSNHLLHTGNGTLLLVPFPEPGRWRIVDTADVEGADDPEVIRARLAAKLARALGRDIAVSTPTWVSVFTVQQRMVDRMQAGRCFVAGDAAHVHSPASGQGMNTGIQDAYNLAWKLADVVRGHASERLLDSYTLERGPIGETLLKSTRTATAFVALRNAAARVTLPPGMRLINAVKPLKRKLEGKMIRGFCGLALHYPDSPLTLTSEPPLPEGIQPGERVGCSTETEKASSGWQALSAQLTDPRWILLAFGGGPELDEIHRDLGAAVAVRTIDGAGPGPLPDPGGFVRESFGVHGAGYAVIRPDGYLAAKGGRTEQLKDVLNGLNLLPGPVSGSGSPRKAKSGNAHH